MSHRVVKVCCEKMGANQRVGHNQGIEVDEAGNFNLNGCCGGGCWVAWDLQFCPWCGEKLRSIKER